jgi:hypothetical protein
VLFVHEAIFTLVFLNNFVMNLVSFLMYVNVTNFFLYVTVSCAVLSTGVFLYEFILS